MKKAGILVFQFIIVLLLFSCNQYEKPGQRGKSPIPDPSMWNAGQNAIFYEEKNIPDSLHCEETYALTIRNSEVAANCENYDYSLLYNKGMEYFNKRTTALKCKITDCDILSVINIFQSAICNNNIATVILKFEIKCVRNENPDHTGLPFRIGNELKAPFKDSFPVPMPVKNETYLVQLWNDANAHDCPYDFEFKIDLTVPVTSCGSITNYFTFIERAEAKAYQIWYETLCATQDGCHKHDLQEIGVKWDCQNSKVRIEYWFKVPCSDQ